MEAALIFFGFAILVLAGILVWLFLRNPRSGDFSSEFKKLDVSFQGLKDILEERRKREDDVWNRLDDVHRAVTGTRKGQTGERIIGESLKQLPREWWEADSWVNGNRVEYAVKVGNGRLLPIDSKFTTDVGRHIKEVAKYIDPTRTTPFAIMTVPDDAFGALSAKVISDAFFRDKVLILSWNVTVPFILSYRSLRLQYAQAPYIEQIIHITTEIHSACENINRLLSNEISRAIRQLDEAHRKVRSNVGEIQSAMHSLDHVPQNDHNLKEDHI